MRPICAQRPFAGALAKAAARAPIDQGRQAVRRNVSKAAGIVAGFLAKQAPKLAQQLVEALGLEKARGPAGGDAEELARAAARARAALDALDFDDWAALVELIEPTLQAMARDGAAAGLAQIGASAEDVQAIAGDRAAAWAAGRAAEMVGMKRTADGELVPNPDARWRIDDTTREMLRVDVEQALQEGWSADKLASAIEDNAAFSAERAEMVARTEMAKADMAGAMQGYRASGLVAGKFWSTSQDDKVSDECRACEDAGVLPLDSDFPSGESAPPNHPNCRCTVLPVLSDEMPTAGKSMKGPAMPKILWTGAESFRLAFPITKTEKTEDGRLMVEGVATSEALDSDNEVIDYESAKAAFSRWAGNIREQHDPKKAVGKAVEVVADDDVRQIVVKAFISAGAPDTQAKILDGTLGSFSIGGKVASRASTTAKNADGAEVMAQRVFVKRLSELSVVDVGANPDSGLALAKADDADETEAQPAPADLIAKYAGEEIGDAAAAIQALQTVFYLLYKEASEPGEPPEQVAALRAVVDNLKRFIASEIAEDNADKAAAAGNLAKAGKRFSTATKAALKAAHDACRAADKALADLGYDADDEAAEGEQEGQEGEAGKADAAADLQKGAAAAEAEQVAEIAKAAGLDLAEPTAAGLAKAALAELVELRKAHDALKALPAAPKGARMALPVSKTADRAGQENEPAPVVKADGAVDDVATLIKAAQARPIRVS